MSTAWRAVLFDLDGVLVDSYDAWFRTLNVLADDLGYPPVSREVFAAGWGQGIEEDVRRFYWNHRREEIAARMDEAFPGQLAHVRVDPQARPVLEALRARGVATALVTNGLTDLATAILATGGLELDAVVGCDDAPRPKPAPDIVLRACERLGVAPGEALVVGDTGFDREAARAAGASFAGLRCDGERRLERLEEVLLLPGLGAPAPAARANVEVKARCADPAALRRRAEALATAYVGVDRQVDTYFRTRAGRLKLRESSLSGGQLVPYLRLDAEGPRRSDYRVIPVPDPEGTRDLLAALLGVHRVVRKEREIFLHENVRIHLDRVEGLGTFMELEAVFDGSPEEEPAQRAKVERLLRELGVSAGDLVATSYEALLAEGEER